MAKPICFMVMPFGTKSVQPAVEGAPKQIDFDELWNKALSPVIVELGYEAVRADQDTGAGIILEMLERLFFSDLVVADMTIPNGNVYYEVGIRHACRQRGCVLISAEWTRTLFDVNQMRRLTYPLPEGAISDATAAKIRESLMQGIRGLAEGTSPVYQHIPGFPDPEKVDPSRASAIREQLSALAEFQARVRTAEMSRDSQQSRKLALELRDDFPPSAPMPQAVAVQILTVLRDCVGWEEMLRYADALPASIRELDLVQEQRCLAQSKSGNHELAIAALEELIERRRDSSERRGLIGGRYKKLADAAKKNGKQIDYEDYLDQAIQSYDKGMRLDLNDFYPSSNLPFLYRERGLEGDEDRASVAAQVAMLACERDAENPWAKTTLLTLAFFDEDVDRARRCAREVRRQGAATWKLDTTLDTLERSVAHAREPERKEALTAILAELRSLLPKS